MRHAQPDPQQYPGVSLPEWIRLLEARSRRLLAASLTAGTIVCGLGIHCLQPALVRYRGASGVASALLAAMAVLLFRTGESRWSRTAAALGLVLLFGKVVAEIMTGQALFAGPLPPGIEVTPMVHLAGALTGVSVAFAISPRPHRAVKRG